MYMYLHVSALIYGHICVYVQVYLCVYMYSYMDIYVHVFAYVFYFQYLPFNIFSLYLYFFTFLQDTECKLSMCKGEVSISDSLLLPPFSNHVVK